MYMNNICFYSNINNTTNGSHCTVTLITQLMISNVIYIEYYININNTTNGKH